MKVLRFLLPLLTVVFLSTASRGDEAPKAKAPVIATTVDFLDFVFYDKQGSADYYPAEQFEKHVAAYRDAGIRKLYLRTDCNGLRLFPSKATLQYGEQDLYHYEDLYGARRLMGTMKRYDILMKVIELGHKYGMEVWCWEAISWQHPGFAYGWGNAKVVPEMCRLNEKCGGMPFLDPYFRSHPECFLMRNPKTAPQKPQDSLSDEAAIRKFPIGRIRFVNVSWWRQKNLAAPQYTADDIDIYYGEENGPFQRYDKPYQVTCGKTPDGDNYLEINKLELNAKYVKLTARKRFGDRYTLVLNTPLQNQVFNTQGQLLDASWGFVCDTVADGDLAAYKADTPLSSAPAATHPKPAWDYRDNQVGFRLGDNSADYAAERYYYGMVEFNVPQAMAHMLDKFREIAAYPFDGYLLTTYAQGYAPLDEYDYNPEVRDLYLKRHGVDIYKTAPDLEKLRRLRAEGIADYIRECKRILGPRKLYLTGEVPGGPDDGTRRAGRMTYRHLPWLYERYFADGIDGVLMYQDFREHFTPAVTGGRPFTLGMTRCLAEKGYDFPKDLEALLQRGGLDELEFYETLVFLHRPAWLAELKRLLLKYDAYPK